MKKHCSESVAHTTAVVELQKIKKNQLTLESTYVNSSQRMAPLNAYRHKVCEILLRLGVPLNILDDDQFRNLIEQPGEKICGRAAVADFIPNVLEAELKLLKSEFAQKEVSITFDGATFMREEAEIMIVRSVSNYKVFQRLVGLRMLYKVPDLTQVYQIISTTQWKYASIHIYYPPILGSIVTFHFCFNSFISF